MFPKSRLPISPHMLMHGRGQYWPAWRAVVWAVCRVCVMAGGFGKLFLTTDCTDFTDEGAGVFLIRVIRAIRGWWIEGMKIPGVFFSSTAGFA